MDLPVPDSLKELCSRFRIDWNKGNLPKIADFLDGISEPVRTPLMAELIAVELELRIAAGKNPDPEDYAQLGSDAVAMARRILAESDQSLPDQFNDPTAFFSVDALGDKSETFSFDGDDDTLFRESDNSVERGGESKFIGRYKLLQQIGIGGMGAVWMAEQLEPVKRRVALKVIRADVGTKSAVARFEAERQACALMDHQNIAKILDAGTTETGNPYFVMELVNGVPLNQYCDKYKLGIRERLDLMIPVCRAIQHAHQKGIIHRDLKHSNVLVTEYDGKPVPKVIDFGLAKALGHQDTLTDKTMFTELGKVVGTLQYMSPEQAETSNLDIDTRSDVYSLGVMIYKLLVGATPLDDGTLVQKSLLDALKIIREKDPSRPSIRLSLNQDVTEEICRLRQVQPEKLKQILEGDLDWIVMKALEKDRRDRYETANGLAMELERYLNDEQVLARPPSAVYSVKKFVKRNRGLVASIMALSFLLIAGILATSSATVWALKERKIANENALLAEEKSRLAETEAERASKAQSKAEDAEWRRKIELLGARLTSAWSDWLLGKTEPAWLTLKKMDETENGWEARYLRSEFSSSEDTLYGHSRFVVTIDVSDDGKYIATGAHDDSIKVWDAVTKQLLYTRLVEDLPTCVRFSPDSSLIACADRANQISFWSVKTGELRQTCGPYDTDIACIEFLDDNRIVAGAADRDSLADGNQRQFIEGEDASPPPIRIIAFQDGEVHQTLDGHSADITSISCSKDGQTIASGSLDNTIRIWRKNGERFEPDYELNKQVSDVTSVSISPTEKKLLSSHGDNTIRLWELETGELICTFVGHTDDVNSARFSFDGKRIVSASSDRTARVWNLDGEEILLCKGHFDTLNDATFSLDGQEILTASVDQTARAWSSTDKPSTVTVHAHTNVVWCADFSSDGKIVASANQDGTIALIETHTGDIKSKIGEEGDLEILAIAYSPESNYIATGGEDHRVLIWDPQDSSLVTALVGHDDFIWGVDFSTDGKFLLTASADETAKIWNTQDWSLVETLEGHTSEVASARFSGDGKLIVTASDDGTVKLWEKKEASFELIETLEGHTNAVWKAIFSPDDKLVASSGYNGEIIIWDVAKRIPVLPIQAHTSQIAGLAFSKDGTRLVSASDDRSIKIWDVASGIELFLLRDQGDSQIVHVSFSDDGTKLVSGNAEGWVTIRAVSDEHADARPFLPQNAEEYSILGEQIITSPDATVEELQRVLRNAEKCCKYYPSYKSYTNLGIAQYRLGMLDDAIENLTEADRLEPIHYGQPDERPNIEGFLAMALFRTGINLARANELRAEFEAKRKENWSTDERITALAEEVDGVFTTIK